MDGANARRKRPRRFAGGAWTDERIALLKRRWSRGASAGRIARELGGGISRQAVLGKIHRLGLTRVSRRGGARRNALAAEPDRHARKRAPQSRPGGRVGAAPSWAQRSLPGWAVHAKPHADDALVDADIPLSQRRALLELDRHTCRWPIGDPRRPDFLFCGAEPRKGKPYCAAHCARAYLPAEAMAPRAAHANLRPPALGFSGPRDRVGPATIRPLIEEKR
jgi:GcrA cell cycle regulator